MADFHILIADDDSLVRDSLNQMLTQEGYKVSTASNGLEAVDKLKCLAPDLVILDIKMPQMSGIEALDCIKKDYPRIPVVLMTGFATVETAVAAMRQGAYDYISKPINDNQLKSVIEKVMDQCRLALENKQMMTKLACEQRARFQNIVGSDPKMQKIYGLIETISNTRSTVLINGESGTGKRLIAHAIHNCNQLEKDKPFIEISCGALTETLLETELFGHVKGAFTGAIKDRVGRFELADGGTIFLDEIDAFSPNLQVKLLRVLQEGELERVGDTRTIKVNVRVIAATNQHLHELIAQGKFRTDLFYRLNIIGIGIPPLRERKGDIPLLVREFIAKHAPRVHKDVLEIGQDALSALLQYNWPGNVRELENVIERAMVLTKNHIIQPDDLPDFFSLSTVTQQKQGQETSQEVKLKEALDLSEREYLVKTLEKAYWNRNEAARLLGINRTTLYKKMLKFGLITKDTKWKRSPLTPLN